MSNLSSIVTSGFPSAQFYRLRSIDRGDFGLLRLAYLLERRCLALLYSLYLLGIDNDHSLTCHLAAFSQFYQLGYLIEAVERVRLD